MKPIILVCWLRGHAWEDTLTKTPISARGDCVVITRETKCGRCRGSRSIDRSEVGHRWREEAAPHTAFCYQKTCVKCGRTKDVDHAWTYQQDHRQEPGEVINLSKGQPMSDAYFIQVIEHEVVTTRQCKRCRRHEVCEKKTYTTEENC